MKTSSSEKPTSLEDAVLFSDIGIDPNSAVAIMPKVLSQLLEAEQLLNNFVNMQGAFFVEMMAAERIVNLDPWRTDQKTSLHTSLGSALWRTLERHQ